jgi:hypothetical protein
MLPEDGKGGTGVILSLSSERPLSVRGPNVVANRSAMGNGMNSVVALGSGGTLGAGARKSALEDFVDSLKKRVFDFFGVALW